MDKRPDQMAEDVANAMRCGTDRLLSLACDCGLTPIAAAATLHAAALGAVVDALGKNEASRKLREIAAALDALDQDAPDRCDLATMRPAGVA